VAVGQGTGKVILQTFEKNSLELLQRKCRRCRKSFCCGSAKATSSRPPTCRLPHPARKTKRLTTPTTQGQAEFQRWIDYAKAQGAIGTGPSAALTQGGEQSYADLVKPWMNQYTHDQGLLVHVYTLDDAVDFQKVMDAGVDGIFTNRASELLKFYKRPAAASVEQVLRNNGF
jgi:glycerophosphoryl diester phosphodiesterase